MTLVFQAILSRGSAEQIIKIDHNIYKRSKRLTERVWCTKGKGSGWWGVESRQPREDRGLVMKPLRGWVTNLSLVGSKQCRLEAETHGEQATTLCNKTKSSQTCQTKHEFYHLTFHFEEVATENLWDSAILYQKTLGCWEETSPKIGLKTTSC